RLLVATFGPGFTLHLCERIAEITHALTQLLHRFSLFVECAGQIALAQCLFRLAHRTSGLAQALAPLFALFRAIARQLAVLHLIKLVAQLALAIGQFARVGALLTIPAALHIAVGIIRKALLVFQRLAEILHRALALAFTALTLALTLLHLEV